MSTPKPSASGSGNGSTPAPSQLRTTDIANAGFAAPASTGAQASKAPQPDFLVVLLDINPFAWADAAEDSSDARSGEMQGAAGALKKALDAVLVLMNAHVAMQHENGLAVYAAGLGSARLLYSTAASAARDSVGAKPDANTYQHFKHVDDMVSEGVREMVRDMTEANADQRKGPIGIVRALSQALCHINRLTLSDQNSSDAAAATNRSSATPAGAAAFRSRILVLSVTPDASTQYVPIMNCIFGAQKKGILIDVCKLFGDDTVFLQQASHLTGGSYFRLDDRRGLLQTLMTSYLPSRSIRNLLHLPMQDEVDFRAACFCHRDIVDVGYVCSVCLSIFCQPREVCSTCKSRFPSSTLERLTSERTGPGRAPANLNGAR